MLKTNKDRLVKMSVIGEVVSPVVGSAVYTVSANGDPMILPGVGGITYNVRVGDLATGRGRRLSSHRKRGRSSP